MPGIGTVVNALAIVAGGFLGLLFKRGIPELYRTTIFNATGTGVFVLGVTGVITAAVTAAQDGTLSSSFGLVLILSLVLGGILGEALRIEDGFDHIGEFIKKRMGSVEGQADAGAGFAAATVLFCSGAMAILGAIADGSAGDPSMLYTKALLDGITALIFATVYGPAVIFSAVSVLVYQGVMTLFAVRLSTWLAPVVITQMSMTGSAVLLLIAFSLWDIKKFRVASLIPAVFMPILLSLLPL